LAARSPAYQSASGTKILRFFFEKYGRWANLLFPLFLLGPLCGLLALFSLARAIPSSRQRKRFGDPRVCLARRCARTRRARHHPPPSLVQPAPIRDSAYAADTSMIRSGLMMCGDPTRFARTPYRQRPAGIPDSIPGTWVLAHDPATDAYLGLSVRNGLSTGGSRVRSSGPSFKEHSRTRARPFVFRARLHRLRSFSLRE
jgi:hypothetical protein